MTNEEILESVRVLALKVMRSRNQNDLNFHLNETLKELGLETAKELSDADEYRRLVAMSRPIPKRLAGLRPDMPVVMMSLDRSKQWEEACKRYEELQARWLDAFQKTIDDMTGCE